MHIERMINSVNMKSYFIPIRSSCVSSFVVVAWLLLNKNEELKKRKHSKHETYPRCHQSVTPVHISKHLELELGECVRSKFFMSSFIRGIIARNDNFYENVIPVYSLLTFGAYVIVQRI